MDPSPAPSLLSGEGGAECSQSKSEPLLHSDVRIDMTSTVCVYPYPRTLCIVKTLFDFNHSINLSYDWFQISPPNKVGLD